MHNWQKQTVSTQNIGSSGIQMTGWIDIFCGEGLIFLVHDDVTLAIDERYECCEISRCEKILALNICLENSDSSNESITKQSI